MSFKIYTKVGDKGNTSLIGGTKVLKSNIRINSYGTVDELNAHIGLIIDSINNAHCIFILKEIQDRLFTIGSSLACDPNKDIALKIPDLKEMDITILENEIDNMETELPPLKYFILPGGHPTISFIHIARCVCRRAERNCVALTENKEFVEPIVLQYLNRLSDYLFVLSRFISKQINVQEVYWKPRNN